MIHSALHAQHTNAQYLVRWNMGGFLLSPEKAAAIATKLQTRIETIQQKAFEAGHLICLHSHQVPGDPLKRIVVETLTTLYSKELLAVMQDPQHPRPIKSVNHALASKGKQAPHLTDEQKQFCDNLVAGKLEVGASRGTAVKCKVSFSQVWKPWPPRPINRSMLGSYRLLRTLARDCKRRD